MEEITDSAPVQDNTELPQEVGASQADSNTSATSLWDNVGDENSGLEAQVDELTSFKNERGLNPRDVFRKKSGAEVFSPSEPLSTLQWWKREAHRFPILAKLARVSTSVLFSSSLCPLF